MKVIWPCPWFGDYRVPVFARLNEYLNGDLMVYYAAPEEGNRLGVTESTHKKMIAQLGNSCLGLQGKKIEIGDSSSDMANKSLIIRYQPDLYKRLKKFNPDIVIAETFGGWSMISIAYALIHRKKLMMFYERTAHVERNSPWWRTWYRKLLGKPVKHFLINGNETRNYLNQLGFRKVPSTQGLMVSDTSGLERNVTVFCEADRSSLKEHLKLDQGLTYLFVGQMVERKGVREMCCVWQNHQKDYPHDNLVVIGAGILLEECRNNYTKMQNIHFLGHINYDDIYKYYAIADVFLMPTLEDNWCLVVPEAMACGLPIACSIYNGGHSELVKKDINGISFDTLNPNDFLEALAYFHSVDLKQFAINSRKIVAGFTPEIAAEKIFKACKKVMEG